jgi:hypothetical protein
MYQGSLSLDNENDKGCIELCIGFNDIDKIKHFANVLKHKGTLSDGFVKQMNTTVLSATLQGELKVK